MSRRGLVHGRERDRRRRRGGAVVEADDGDVLGNAAPPLAQHRERTGRHEVARHEEAVEVGHPVEQPPGGGDRACHGEVGRLDRVGGPARGSHRTRVALEPVDAGGHVERAGDGADAAAVDRDEVLGGRHAAFDVVDVDVECSVSDSCDGRPPNTMGTAPAASPQRVVALVVRDDESAVDDPRRR